MVPCHCKCCGEPIPIKCQGRAINGMMGIYSALTFAKKKLLKFKAKFPKIVNSSGKEGLIISAKRFSKIRRSFSSVAQMVDEILPRSCIKYWSHV